MAQLTLTVAGYAIGGPFGGFVGGFLGGIIDRKWLFPQKAIEGPRLEDLKVQTSSYGNAISQLWGTMRLAGNVIWAKDIDEIKDEEGGGCFGGPKQVSYTYKATFAVGICKGEIDGIVRIWADTKVIYDARPFDATEIPTGVPGRRGGIEPVRIDELNERVYLGTESQTADSWIEDVEGAGNVPGYRGLAYIVFKDFPLADYGNRIPNFTFEVTRNATAQNQVVDQGPNTNVLDDDQPGIFQRWALLLPDGYTIMTEGFIYNFLTGTQFTLTKIGYDFPEGPIYGPGAMDYDEEGLVYYQVRIDSVSYFVVLDPISKIIVRRGPALDYPALTLSGYWLDVFKNPWHPYLWFTGGSTVNYDLIRIRREDLGATYDRFARPSTGRATSFIFSNVAERFSDGAGWIAMIEACYLTGFTDPQVRIGVIFPTGLFRIYDVTSDIPAGVLNIPVSGGHYWDHYVVYDEASQRLVLVYEESRPSFRTTLHFFNIIDDVPVYDSSILSIDGQDLWMGFPFSSLSNNPGDGKMYVQMADVSLGSSDVTSTRFASVDIATGTVIDIWVPDEFGGGTSWTFIYLPLFNAMWIDWWNGVGGEVHDNYAYVLFDRVSSGGTLLSAIVTEVCAQIGLSASDIDVTELTDTVAGFVLNNRMTARAALEPLMTAYFFDAAEADGKIVFVKRGGTSAMTIPQGELATHPADSKRPQEITHVRQQELELPTEVEVGYVDAEFGYQTNTQNARRLVTQSDEKVVISLPINMTPDEAKQVAVKSLVMAWLQRDGYQISVPVKRIALVPSDVVTVQAADGDIVGRVVDESLNGRVIDLTLAKDDASAYVSDATGVSWTGTGTQGEPQVPVSEATRLFILDMPLLRSADNKPGVLLAAMGDTADWPGADVSVSLDGTNWEFLTQMTGRATCGKATTALAAPADVGIMDKGNTVTVQLLDDTDSLASITDSALLSGSNLAILGDEVIQFQTVVDNGNGSFTLSDFIRGLYGTERVTGDHSVGDVFVLVDFNQTSFVELPIEYLGQLVQFRSTTFGLSTTYGQKRSATIQFVNLKPLSPVHLTGTRAGSGDVTFTWTRRTRLGGEWLDSVDVPLGETSLAFDIEVYDGASLVSTTEDHASTTLTITSSELTAMGFGAGDPVTIIVYQKSSTVGRGFPSDSYTLN